MNQKTKFTKSFHIWGTKDISSLAPHWGWLLALGIAFIILGFIGLGIVASLTVISMMFFGVLLIIGGVAHIVYIFTDKGWRGALWHAVLAILYIVAGCDVLYDPMLASAVITAFLAGAFIVIGIMRLIAAYNLKDSSGWGWLLIAGLASIILGIIILYQWPYSGLWLIGLLIAIEMIVAGWSYIFIALAAKNIRRSERKHT